MTAFSNREATNSQPRLTGSVATPYRSGATLLPYADKYVDIAWGEEDHTTIDLLTGLWPRA